MNRGRVIALLITASVLALARGPAVCSHKWAEHDPIAPFTRGNTPRAVVVAYFTASKDGDAARASSLIDYNEWARRRGLEGERAKEFGALHRAALEEAYRLQKAAGATKEFEIVKETVERETAVFEITQERSDGVHLYEVTLALRGGRWAIVDFALKTVGQRLGG